MWCTDPLLRAAAGDGTATAAAAACAGKPHSGGCCAAQHPCRSHPLKLPCAVPLALHAVGDDLAQLLRTLAVVLEPGHMLYSPLFHAEPPAACPTWSDVPAGVWAAPPAPGAPPGHQPGAGGAGGPLEIDLTEEAPAVPQTPSRQVAAATWKAAMVDAMGHGGGWTLLLQVGARGGAMRREWEARPVGLQAWPQGGMAELPRRRKHRKCHTCRRPAAPPCNPLHPSHAAPPTPAPPTQLLARPERLGDYLWAFLMPLSAAAPAVQPERCPALAGAVSAVVQYVRACLEAVADLSALEGSSASPELRVSRVSTRVCGGGALL